MGIEDPETMESVRAGCSGTRLTVPELNPRTERSRTLERTLLALLFIGIFYTIYFAKAIIVPVLLALILTALFKPVVHQMHRLRVPESIGAAVAVLLFAGLVTLGVYRLSDPAAKWLDKAPIVLSHLRYKLYPFQKTIRDAQKTTSKIEEMTNIREKEQKVVVEGPSLAQRVFGYAKSFALTALIVLFLLYFLLGFGSASIKRMSANDARSRELSRWKGYFEDISGQVGIYIQTLSLINLGLGVATSILMAILGMPNPILWGVLSALLNFIPYVGAMVMTIMIGIVSFITFESWSKILLAPVLFLCLTGLEGLVVQTLTLGKRLALNPVMVFLSFLVWGWLWGPVGVFLAVPILVAFKIVVDREESLKPIRPLIGKAISPDHAESSSMDEETEVRTACA
jgi:predicted PurR-regulated permease PerM